VRAGRRALLWAPVALLLGFEFYLSSQSRLPSIPLHLPHLDKLEHAAYFFLTGAVAVRAARFGERWSRVRTAVILLAAALLWGCSDEYHQSFVPGRDVEAADVAADVTGVLLAVLLAESLWIRLKLDETKG
jgi:VanZ family protein